MITDIIAQYQRDGVFDMLKTLLNEQIKNAEDNAKLEYGRGNKQLAVEHNKERKHMIKDVESLQSVFDSGGAVPRYHYETRRRQVEVEFDKIGESEIEVSIPRGINVSPPNSDGNHETYVKFDLPIPPDTPQIGTSQVGKGTAVERMQAVTRVHQALTPSTTSP